MDKKKLKYVTLIATEACNLSCTYCYELHKTHNSFDINLTKKIIEKELFLDDDYEEVSFEFFGGEPFLEFEKIKSIVEFFKGKVYPKKFSFFAGTNGTLLTKNTKQWLLDNKDIFSLGLSIDGTKEMHNINRSNSFDMIDIPFFVSNYENIVVKMTISPQTISSLSSGVIFLYKLGFKAIRCNLAQGVDWNNDQYSIILERELYSLIDYYLKNPNLMPCDLLDYNIQNVAYKLENEIIKFCGAGTRMKVYDIKGDFYPCQYFLPLSIGDKSNNISDLHFSDRIKIGDLDKQCQKCVGVTVCPSCYGANYAITGNIHGRDNSFCRLTKIIIKANSYFKAKQWQLGQLKNLSNKEITLLLKGIIRIQNEL